MATRFSRNRSAFYSRNGSYSRSYNAEIAESEGRAPATRAAQQLGLSVKQLRHLGDGEWHHVGRFAARVNYYDVAAIRNGEIELKQYVAAQAEPCTRVQAARLTSMLAVAAAQAVRQAESEIDETIHDSWTRLSESRDFVTSHDAMKILAALRQRFQYVNRDAAEIFRLAYIAVLQDRR